MNEEISIRVENGVGRITLQRPKALHALSHDMCGAVIDSLVRWSDDPNVHVVMLDHQPGTRGFCAGGDIRMLARSGAGDAVEGRAFFANEYRMNVWVHRFPKPYIALIDGVTMGGGAGISVHGRYRVATESTVFAMPENGVGLFTDIGGGWFLPRLEGRVGLWMGLTGARLKGSDVVAVGAATHYFSSEAVQRFKADVLAMDLSGDADRLVSQLLDSYAEPIPEPEYRQQTAVIDRCFSRKTAEEIVAALDAESSEWASEQSAVLRRHSPESVKVSLREMQIGAQLDSFEENMKMEYRIAWRKVASHDFIEGVRALLVDKDHNPVWSPATLEEITDGHVDRFFEPLGAHELPVD